MKLNRIVHCIFITGIFISHGDSVAMQLKRVVDLSLAKDLRHVLNRVKGVEKRVKKLEESNQFVDNELDKIFKFVYSNKKKSNKIDLGKPYLAIFLSKLFSLEILLRNDKKKDLRIEKLENELKCFREQVVLQKKKMGRLGKIVLSHQLKICSSKNFLDKEIKRITKDFGNEIMRLKKKVQKVENIANEANNFAHLSNPSGQGI